MPIEKMTPGSAIDNYIADFFESKNRMIIRIFCVVGEKCVNEARTNGSYQDQTGNLRGSIGDIVVEDGIVVQTGGFGQVKSGAQGRADGQAFARQILAKFLKGIHLVAVAGRKYAIHVSAKGYNVLDSAELLAEKLVLQNLEKLGFKRK